MYKIYSLHIAGDCAVKCASVDCLKRIPDLLMYPWIVLGNKQGANDAAEESKDKFFNHI